VGELQSALDALVAEDLDGMAAEQLLDRSARLAHTINRLQAEFTRTVRRCETTQAAEHDGQSSMRPWLRNHLRLSAREAAGVVRNGRTIEQLPVLESAFAAGAVSAEHVATIAPVAAPGALAKAAEQGIDLTVVDATLAEVAATQTHADLGKAVQHYLALLDTDGPEPDPTEGRSMWLVKHSDGSVTGRFELDAVGGEKVQAALEAFVQADRPAGDVRTRSQQLADGFVQWADVTLASGTAPILRTVKPHAIVSIPLADLVDPATGPGVATTGFGAQISAARARWLACDGGVIRVVIGPDGQPLDLGRTHRVVPPHLRRAADLRDQGCIFTGCDAPAHWCDIHHLIHWADGGDTAIENLASLCERHHTKVHHGFRVERQPDGTWRTYRPDGTEILIPAPL
jgi:hypothetical protein